MNSYYELNIDSLVGPNHNYAGIAQGNIASQKHALLTSNPQAAALQGIAKMRLLHDLGIKQAVLPPQLRPNLPLLASLGFTGSQTQQVKQAYLKAPGLLASAYSASSMWMANAATVSPSCNTRDAKVHFTPANLVSHLHRAQEVYANADILKQVFNDDEFFFHHTWLPQTMLTRDEGAANHLILCPTHGQEGIEIFIYGAIAHGKPILPLPKNFNSRQTLEACEAIVRSHNLDTSRVLYVYQNPRAIDAGAFHNDVVAVANENLLLIHEDAWYKQAEILQLLRKTAQFKLEIIEVPRAEISLTLAIESYLFNSQLLTLPDKTMVLIAPAECQSNPKVHGFIASMLEDKNNPISQVFYLDLKQSMQNGGGPACLRLRVVLSQAQLNAVHQKILVSHSLLDKLETLVQKYYRTSLSSPDLADPELINECSRAHQAIFDLLDLHAPNH